MALPLFFIDFKYLHFTSSRCPQSRFHFGGPIALLSQAERYHWLVAPSSTIIQPAEAHTGLTADPAATLDHLFHALVEGPPTTA